MAGIQKRLATEAPPVTCRAPPVEVVASAVPIMIVPVPVRLVRLREPSPFPAEVVSIDASPADFREKITSLAVDTLVGPKYNPAADPPRENEPLASNSATAVPLTETSMVVVELAKKPVLVAAPKA